MTHFTGLHIQVSKNLTVRNRKKLLIVFEGEGKYLKIHANKKFKNPKLENLMGTNKHVAQGRTTKLFPANVTYSSSYLSVY